MEFTMQRHDLNKLLRGIEENTKRGFVQVEQIQKIIREYRNFKYDNYCKKYNEFSHTNDNTLYCVKMRGEKR